MRNLTPTVKYLLIINSIVFAISCIFTWFDPYSQFGGAQTDLFGLHFFLADNFHIYQLFTYMFLHGGFMHLFFNMFALWMFGTRMERALGEQRFLTMYLLCGIGAGLFQELAQFGEYYLIVSEKISDMTLAKSIEVAHQIPQLGLWTTVGASGAIYGILLAFAIRFPNEPIYIFPLPIPIKAKWFICIYIVIELASVIGTANDGVAHVAHLGGMVIAYFLMRRWRKRPYYYNGNKYEDNLFGNLRNMWQRRKDKASQRNGDSRWGGNGNAQRQNGGSARQADLRVDSINTNWTQHSTMQQDQEVIDTILDKIRKSGYDSLTAEEKRTLFTYSNKK